MSPIFLPKIAVAIGESFEMLPLNGSASTAPTILNSNSSWSFKVKTLTVDTINVYDLLKYNKLVVTEDTVKKLEEVYA
mgnify:CR=1 FL=1